jgi:hypothetical protein
MSPFDILKNLDVQESRPPDVVLTIEEIRQKFEDIRQKIADLDIPENYSGPILSKARRQSILFDSVINFLPDTFELFSFEPEFKPLRSLRLHFHKKVKSTFLESVVHAERDSFRRMGLSDTEIDALLTMQGECAHDISIDHIISLKFGGRNNYKNLCVVPSHVNSLKEAFESVQEDLEISDRMLSFRPRNGAIVPLVKGGFRSATSSLSYSERTEEIRKRRLEFLGCDI